MSERSIADILDNEHRLARQVQKLREHMREQDAAIQRVRDECERAQEAAEAYDMAHTAPMGAVPVPVILHALDGSE